MSSASEMTALTREVAEHWIAREERTLGLRMAAYERVAMSIGASASWLRKFVAGHAEAKQPDWTIGWNLLASYRRLCERIEAERENERAIERAIQGRIDAAVESALELVAGAVAPETRGKDSRADAEGL